MDGKPIELAKMSTAEDDYLLMPIDPMSESINSYADTAIQFGFVSLFVTALPAAPVLALIR